MIRNQLGGSEVMLGSGSVSIPASIWCSRWHLPVQTRHVPNRIKTHQDRLNHTRHLIPWVAHLEWLQTGLNQLHGDVGCPAVCIVPSLLPFAGRQGCLVFHKAEFPGHVSGKGTKRHVLCDSSSEKPIVG